MTTGDFETAFWLWLITFGPLVAWSVVSAFRHEAKIKRLKWENPGRDDEWIEGLSRRVK